MSEHDILLQFIISSFLAGITATYAMTLFLSTVARHSSLVVHPLAALGSIISSEHQPAPRIGLLLHLMAGLIFSILYSLVLFLSPASALYHFIFFGAGIGLVHGFVIFFLLIPPLAEHHPSKKIRADGPVTALTYSSAHIIFGICVGLIVGLYRLYL